MRFVAETLVVVGALLLVAALVPLNALIPHLPETSIRTRWRALRGAVLVAVAGYGVYLVLFWERHQSAADLAVPAVFLAAGALIAAAFHVTAQAVDAVRQAVRPERDTVTDALLGVFNRRYLEHRLAEEVARARRYQAPLSVLLFDLDHFRRLNEKWGRVVGDRVLSYLGNLLVGAVRQSDVVARYGGEEIIVIAPNTALQQAAELADRLRAAVEKEDLGFGGEAGGQPELQVTVSVGVAEFGAEETDWGPLVDRVEDAVSRAKRAGRNRVAS
jgi:diguanylate cyclase (GGDEF)-like protein